MFGSTSLALFALSCSGTSGIGNDNRAPAASVGDEPPPQAATNSSANEAAPTPALTPAQAPRGRLTLQSKVAGKIVQANARMLVADVDRPVEFQMGEEIRAESGTQRIEVTLVDDSVLIDTPTLRLDVYVEPNKLAKVEAVFPWAKVQLNVLVQGRLQPPTSVKLVRNGNVVAEVKSGAPAFLISPGTYEADVQVRGKVVRVKGLVFFESTEQVVPVRAQL